MFGSHFRRQVPIEPYIADYACMAARVIIEIDGSQHGDEPVKSRDEVRTRWLEQAGYRVIRFWNNDLTKSLDGVLEAIYAALYGSRDSEAFVLKHTRRLRSSNGMVRPCSRPASA
jgi:very-short-patch-repair endonuclease